MLKGTIKFTLYCVFGFICGCSGRENVAPEPAFAHYNDSVSEARIDSAYAAIQTGCDSMMVYQVPAMVDSFLKDSASLLAFFNNRQLYSDADKKAEKVIRQLLADCDSNLQKETYRRARLQQKSKPVRRKK
jgi:hypothetical protein